MADPAENPPSEITDEASREGLRLAREAGSAYRRMVDYFVTHVASSGAIKRADDYEVAFAVEEAEPLYHLLGAELTLSDPPPGCNAHLEVAVTDATDGRFIPALVINVTLTDVRGCEVGTWDLPFLWHPTMYHYGRNVSVPASGEYHARVSISVPTFPRHDRINGRRYERPLSVTFDGIRIQTGRK